MSFGGMGVWGCDCGSNPLGGGVGSLQLSWHVANSEYRRCRGGTSRQAVV